MVPRVSVFLSPAWLLGALLGLSAFDVHAPSTFEGFHTYAMRLGHAKGLNNFRVHVSEGDGLFFVFHPFKLSHAVTRHPQP